VSILLLSEGQVGVTLQPSEKEAICFSDIGAEVGSKAFFPVI
jgi:hypothetical protein